MTCPSDIASKAYVDNLINSLKGEISSLKSENSSLQKKILELLPMVGIVNGLKSSISGSDAKVKALEALFKNDVSSLRADLSSQLAQNRKLVKEANQLSTQMNAKLNSIKATADNALKKSNLATKLANASNKFSQSALSKTLDSAAKIAGLVNAVATVILFFGIFKGLIPRIDAQERFLDQLAKTDSYLLNKVGVNAQNIARNTNAIKGQDARLKGLETGQRFQDEAIRNLHGEINNLDNEVDATNVNLALTNNQLNQLKPQVTKNTQDIKTTTQTIDSVDKNSINRDNNLGKQIFDILLTVGNIFALYSLLKFLPGAFVSLKQQVLINTKNITTNTTNIFKNTQAINQTNVNVKNVTNVVNKIDNKVVNIDNRVINNTNVISGTNNRLNNVQNQVNNIQNNINNVVNKQINQVKNNFNTVINQTIKNEVKNTAVTDPTLKPLILKNQQLILANQTQIRTGNAIGAKNLGVSLANNRFIKMILLMSQKLDKFIYAKWLWYTNFVTSKWDKLTKSRLYDKAINTMNFLTNLHNATYLSKSVVDTLFILLEEGLAIIGIKDDEGNSFSIGTIINQQLSNLMISILGNERATGISDTWNSLSTIYNTGMNVIYSLSTIVDSSRQLVEITGEYVGKIGNALRKSGVVFENSYQRMQEKFDKLTEATESRWSKFFDRANNLETGIGAFSMVTSNILSIQYAIQDLKNNRQELKTQIAEYTNSQTNSNVSENHDVPIELEELDIESKLESEAPEGLDVLRFEDN
jgi:chromosome segregation ATPase